MSEPSPHPAQEHGPSLHTTGLHRLGLHTTGPHPDDTATGDAPPMRDYTGDYVTAQAVPSAWVDAASGGTTQASDT